MAVAFDAVQSVNGQNVVTLTTPTFTIAAGATAGALGLSMNNNTATGITGNISGVAAVLVPGTDTGALQLDRSMIFSVLAPTTGASKTGKADWTTLMDGILGALTITGGDTVTPMDNGVFASAANAIPALSIQTNSGDLTLMVAASAAVLSVPTQTSRWNIVFNISGAGSTGPGNVSSDRHAWTGTNVMAVSGANFRAPGSVRTGGGAADDRYRFRPSVFTGGGTSTLGTWRDPWPDDARDLGGRDSVADDAARML